VTSSPRDLIPDDETREALSAIAMVLRRGEEVTLENVRAEVRAQRTWERTHVGPHRPAPPAGRLPE
jgi:hypothetical protein